MDEEKEDEEKTSFRVIMHPIKSLIKTEQKLEIIKQAVSDLNRLTSDIYDFIHLHYCRMYKDNLESTIELNQNGINLIASRLTASTLNIPRKYPKEINDTYEIYKTLNLNPPLIRTRYRRLIMELCTDISTSIKNNIVLYFQDRLKIVCYSLLLSKDSKKLEQMEEDKCFKTNIEYEELLKCYRSLARKISFDMIDIDDKIYKYNLKKFKQEHKEDKNYNQLVEDFKEKHKEQKEDCVRAYKEYNLNLDELRKLYMPKYVRAHFKLDIKTYPEHYIKHMIRMNNILKEHGTKQFNCFPHRDVNVLKFITFTTCGIEELFQLMSCAKKKSE